MSREKQSRVSLLLLGYGQQHVLKAAMAMKIAKVTLLLQQRIASCLCNEIILC